MKRAYTQFYCVTKLNDSIMKFYCFCLFILRVRFDMLLDEGECNTGI